MSLFVRHLNKLFLIKEGESATVFYFISFFLLIGFGIALGNASANALFLKRFGIEYLPVIYLIQGGACFIAMMFYASIADLFSAEYFFKIVFILLSSIVLAFWALITFNTEPLLFPAYFLFYEVVVELLLAHSALYLYQNINTLQAKRLSPIIFAGLQIGMVLGGTFLAAFATVIGTSNILLVWFVSMLLAFMFVALWHRMKGPSPYFRPVRKSTHKLQRTLTHVHQGLRFTWESELLRYATIAMVFMVITYYTISYSVKTVYTESFVQEEELTAFFGTISILTSTLALLTQLLLTNRLIRRFGVPTVNLFYPLASLASLSAMILHLGLTTAVTASINIKAVMPAFHNPVRTMFLNILPPQIQGRARAMTMAIVLPVSLMTCGVMLWFMQKLDNPLYFLMPGAFAAGLFLYYSVKMNHAYGRTLLTHLREHLFLPEEQTAASLRSTGKENIAAIVDAIGKADESSPSFAVILVDAYPEVAAEHILPVIKNAPPEIADQLLKIVATTKDPAVYEFLLSNYDLHDNHFRANALTQLINAFISDAVPLLRLALDDPDPRIKTTAIHGALCWTLPELLEQSVSRWRNLLAGTEKEQLTALKIIPDIKYVVARESRNAIEQACLSSAVKIFHTQDSAAKILILNAFSFWQGKHTPEIQQLISDALEHIEPGVRAAAVQCIDIVPDELQYNKLEAALSDGHIEVRNKAVEQLCKKTPDEADLALTWIFKENRGTPRGQETLLKTVINAVPLSALELIIESKIKDARQIHQALLMVGQYQNKNSTSSSNNMRLLQHLLEERFQQVLEIALTAMEPLCARNVISIIRAGIRTLDERHMANACEALNSIPNQTLSQPLGQLIQDAFMHSKQTVTSTSGSFDKMLKSLAMRNDTWLQNCANATLLSLQENN